MIRKVMLALLVGLSCNAMHGVDRWIGQQIDAVTLATGLRQPTAGEQFQQAAHQVGQGVSSFLNNLTTPSSAPSSSNSAVSPSPRTPSARVLQRQELYAQEREEAQKARDDRRAVLEARYRPATSGAAPMLSSSSQQVGLIQQDAPTPETSCGVITRFLSENKETTVLVVGSVSAAALLGIALYAWKK